MNPYFRLVLNIYKAVLLEFYVNFAFLNSMKNMY